MHKNKKLYNDTKTTQATEFFYIAKLPINVGCW
jgi:hypothetical protein